MQRVLHVSVAGSSGRADGLAVEPLATRRFDGAQGEQVRHEAAAQQDVIAELAGALDSRLAEGKCPVRLAGEVGSQAACGEGFDEQPVVAELAGDLRCPFPQPAFCRMITLRGGVGGSGQRRSEQRRVRAGLGPVAHHLRADLAVDALEMAIFARRGQLGVDLVHHPGRGVQYASIRYTQRLEDIGAVRSVGSKGDSYDNSAAEAVNSLYKKELIDREGPWEDAGHVTAETAEWVHWYNNERLPSTCGNVPPAEYENDWQIRQAHTIVIPETKAS
jgi:Integrase core domain